MLNIVCGAVEDYNLTTSTVVRIMEIWGFSAQKYHPKTNLTFPLQQFGSIG